MNERKNVQSKIYQPLSQKLQHDIVEYVYAAYSIPQKGSHLQRIFYYYFKNKTLIRTNKV